jgi:superfamily II RNA helicase
MSYLIQPDLSIPVGDLPANPLKHPLDPFQQYAQKAIHLNHNVLACAPTGTGKSAVGELAIFKALHEGKRAFVTTPIKSLSNQKFGDLKRQFPDTTVGIMTGDVKDRPDAQILVMTTEILRNLLYKTGSKTQSLGLTASLSLENLGLVVFDECHYINDPDRGKVWEECFILLPPTVQIIGLSATIGNPTPFAQWLGALKHIPLHLIQTNHRIVPLTHTVLDPVTDEFQVILSPDEVFHDKTYKTYLESIEAIRHGHEKFKEKVHNKVVTGEKGAVEGKVRPKSFQHQLNHCLDLFRHQHLLPALVFTFSRKGCEENAGKISHSFLDGAQAAEVHHIMASHLHPFKSSLETLPQYHDLKSLLVKGIAYHHSGLIPLLKEIVEILFGKGLIKVLFATETFAVGINMPTKTVVFTGFKKFDSDVNRLRTLRTDEYIQMAGRAGRRGKDDKGLVVYLPDREPVGPYELKEMMKGRRQQVSSKMDFSYDFLLKTLNANNVGWLRIMEQSYWYQQRLGEIALNDQEVIALQKARITIRDKLSDELVAKCELKIALEQAVKDAQGNRWKRAQQELSKWMATNDSQSFQSALHNYHALRQNEKELERAHACGTSLTQHANQLRTPVAFLRQTGYLKDEAKDVKELSADDLTLRGILATEINEAHPILLTELFLSKAAHALNAESLATLLSVFLEDFNKELYLKPSSLDIPGDIVPVLEFLNGEANRLGELEYKCGSMKSEDDWNITLQWTEPIYRWLTEVDVHIASLCAEYGVFEGNFVRGLLKLANVLDEWLSLATFCEHADQVEKITALRSRLVRGVVQPDSLYLKA